MSRCGCNHCVEHRSGCGVDVEYERVDGCDLYTYSFDGECVAGDGLWWDTANHKLHVKVRPDGGIGFDPNGALQLTDQPECQPAVSVAALEGRLHHQDVVIGTLLAGHMYRPQSTHAALQYAKQRGYDGVHVPVTMTADGTPVVLPTTHLERQNGNATPSGSKDPSVDDSAPPPPWAEVHTLDPSGFWGHPESAAETDRARFWNPDVGRRNANLGWFGYVEHPEKRLVLLSDVCEQLGGQTVLFIQLIWPAISDDGTAWVVTDPNTDPPDDYPRTAPPDSRVAAFLTKILTLIRVHQLERSVVVFGRPVVPTENPEVQASPLDRIASAGITVAPYLGSQDEADAYPPDAPEWERWNWVIMGTLDGVNAPDTRPIMVPPERMRPYTDIGKYGLWYSLTRQSDFRDYMAGSDALGAFSADPDYTRGGIPIGRASEHCVDCGDTSYRQRVPEWNVGHVEHGWLPLVEDLWYTNELYPSGAQHPDARGHQQGEDGVATGAYVLTKTHARPDTSTYFVLQGYLQLEDPERYRIRAWLQTARNLSIGNVTSAREVRAEVAFAVNDDHRLIRWGPDSADNSGYIISLRTWANFGEILTWHGRMVLYAWDPSANDGQGDTIPLQAWDLPRAWLDNGYVGIEVHVTPERIWCAPVNRDTWEPQLDPYDSSTDATNGHLGRAESGNRGRNVYFGRGVGNGNEHSNDPEEARFAMWEALPGEHPVPTYTPPPEGADDDGGAK